MQREVESLREALAKAREEVERLTLERDGYETGVRAANRISQAFEARALAAERARDEAVAEVARLKEALSGLLAALGVHRFKGGVLKLAVEAARRALGRTDGEG